MARPIQFPEVTTIENFPDGGPETALPVQEIGNRTVSCWQLTEEELATVATTGQIWLATQRYRHDGVVYQPVVSIHGEKSELLG